MQKQQRLWLILILIFLTAALVASAHAANIWTSDNKIGYTDGSQLSIPAGQTATYDTRTINGETATFTNLNLNSEANTPTLTIKLEGTNATLTSINPEGWLNFTLTQQGTVTLGIGTEPIAVYLDGVHVYRWTSGWTYGSGTTTITGADTTIAIQLTSNPEAIAKANGLDTVFTYFFIAVALIGFIPLIMVVFLFRNGNINTQMAAALMFMFIFLMIAVLVILMFLAGARNAV